MEIKNYNDLILLQSDKYYDKRGGLSKLWTENVSEIKALQLQIREVFFSVSQKGVIRGMHYQMPPEEHLKIVSCVCGSIIDVVIDLRMKSINFGKVYDFQLSPKGYDTLIIPRGFAHGFRSLEDDSTVIYQVDNPYSKAHDTGVRFDTIGYSWGEWNENQVSDRDLKLKPFDPEKVYF